MNKILILYLLPIYCFSQTVLNSNSIEIAKKAEIKFNRDVPTYLKTIKKYAVIQQQATFIGDLTNDGIDDILIWYTWGPKNDISHAAGARFYKTINGKPVYTSDFNPQYRFSVEGIQNNTIYATKIMYAKGDDRCCPSIKNEVAFYYNNKTNIIEQRISELNTTLTKSSFIQIIQNPFIILTLIILLFVLGFAIKIQIKKYKIHKLEKAEVEEERLILKELEEEDAKRKADEIYYRKKEEKRLENLAKSLESQRKRKESIEREQMKAILEQERIKKEADRKEKVRLENEKKAIKEATKKEKIRLENERKLEILQENIEKKHREKIAKRKTEKQKEQKSNEITNSVKQSVDDSLNFDLTKRVNFATYNIIENTSQYPVIKKPQHNSIIRSFRPEGNKRKGYKEAEFSEDIQTVFEDDFYVFDNAMLAIEQGTIPYEPDIAMVSKSGLNIFIDIEIDEPYVGVSRKLTHCVPNDKLRDTFFTDRGWIVIRFSEYQVHHQPMQCLNQIALIIAAIEPSYNIPSEFEYIDNIVKEKCWDTTQASYWERTNYRENYLNHTFAPYNEPYKPLNSALTEKELREERMVISHSIPQPKKTTPPPKRTYQKPYTQPKKPIIELNPRVNVFSKNDIKKVELLVDRAINEGKNIKINYTNYNFETTTRVVSNVKYTSDFIASGYRYGEHFQGYCHLKDREDCSFKLERINSIELIL
ncbi:hypothetical protein ACFQZW_11615 [Lutibacter aestuarii]|uniref:DUF559 domain-containing protein n=1 Tax=Lutibacter aestuarii TaxID=861111 RepID=A0ABW2ZC21_9FLAO